MKTYIPLTMTLLIAAVSTTVWGQNVSSFTDYATRGISVSPSDLHSGLFKYTVSLIVTREGANTVNPGLYSGGKWYDIESIFGFYALNNGNGQFAASGSNFTDNHGGNKDWKWTDKMNRSGIVDLAGWSDNSKGHAVTLTNSVEFSFLDFTVNTNPAPIMGFHVQIFPINGISPFGSGNTAYITKRSSRHS